MIRTVKTENGMIKGLPADDPRVTVFKGVPFAKPPVGDLRWRAPQKCDDWEGVLNAYEFAPISMQDTPALGDDIYCREWHVDSEIPISEDSLYLNVWTGAKSTEDKLPVLVWFYGGGFQWGYTSEMEFNGERIARHGVILVSIAYRLGVFGFLAHPDLSAEDTAHPSNFGILDQQAGLNWVYRNIAAFGGDPENITIAGQSAGGASVLTHLTNEVNEPVIKKACIFSGLIRNPFIKDEIIIPKTLKEAEPNGVSFFEYLGVDSLSAARELDAFYIRDKYAEYARNHPRFCPSIDGVYTCMDPYKALIAGKSLDVPLFLGYTKDEFMYQGINIVKKTVLDTCLNKDKAGYEADWYCYEFAPTVPGEDNPGVFHSCDLWFFFENVPKCHRAYTGAHYELSRNMCSYWTNFIKSGDPNGDGYDGKQLPCWAPAEEAVSADDVPCMKFEETHS